MAIPSGYSLVHSQLGAWAVCSDGDKFRAVAQVYAKDNGTGYDLYLRRYIEVSTVTSAGYAGTVVAIGWTYNGNKSVTINKTGTYAILDVSWCTRAYGASEPVKEADAYGTYTSYGGTKYYSHAGFTYTVPKPTYSVTFDPNGGTLPTPGVAMNGGAFPSNVITMTYGESWYSIINQDIPTRTGYTFNGWYTASSGGTQVYTNEGRYVAGSYWTSSGVWNYKGNVTLYAQWTANTCYISYNANGGSGAPDSHTVTIGEAAALSSTIPTRSGYTFLGWGVASTTLRPTYNAGGSYSFNSDTTLYAIWKNNIQIIKIRKNGSIQGFDFIRY